ncbi:MAG: imidazole glycerol phosphate synthase, glutamine amidotransferase subunit [Chloroflexi bacterium RBG_16_56_11]|nr:MAG: imidazole glycerol phosphate synthase, glutamine amidotransferase subunit [Chloroflexi bacterium RBG_16_56_11]
MITIIDYNAGNIRSVLRACAEVGAGAVTTGDPALVSKANKIIFPGVGAAPSAMAYLQKTGLDVAIKNTFKAGIPVLGICIGAQIVLDSSEEGPQKCLGLVPGKTVRFRLNDKLLKIPHMGWNEVVVKQPHPLLDGIGAGDEFYFVHSFYPRPDNQQNVYAVANHGIDFCAALGYRNLFATQFHPEKSGRLGLELLERFTRWEGR